MIHFHHAVIFLAAACVLRLHSAEPELGSPDFQPSPDHPIGWRSDGTGRYPAATPPVEFERSVKTPLNAFHCQAKKPADDTQAGPAFTKFGGEYHVVKWLVAGPFAPKEGAKPMDSETLPGEAALNSDEGDAAGDLKWRRFESSGGVNFTDAFGGKPAGKIGCALTYFWSPEACRISMSWRGRDVKQWLNGTPASGWERAKHDIKKGWNRLFVKMLCPANQDAWEFKVNFFPNSESNIQYNEKNILWSRTLPASSWSMPVLCGDKIFVTSDPSDLICIDKRNGKMLWVRSNPVWYAALETLREPPSADAPKDPAILPAVEALKPKIDQLDLGNETLLKNLDWNADEKRRKLSQSITDDVRKIDPAFKINIGWGGGNTGPTPVTDGAHIFAWFGETGVMACFDLDGKRLWARFEKAGGGEHGVNSSPVLSGTTLVVIAGGHWAAFDKNTGKLLWRQKYPHPAYATCIVTDIAGIPVVVAPDGQILRVSDGAVIAPAVNKFDGECSSPVLDGKRFFLFSRGGFYCGELPAKAEPAAGTKLVRWIEPKVLDPDREPYPVGSPVFYDGIVYAARSGWGGGTKEMARDVILYAFDPALPEPLYRQKLDMEPALFYGPEGGGVCASLCFAGGNIYVMDNRGTVIVFKPGKEYKQVARNTLDHWTHYGQKEVTGSTPVFEGPYIYLRGKEIMYCIGAQK